MAGRRSLQSPSINRLTSQPETIPSCHRRSRHAEFQPHHGWHLGYWVRGSRKMEYKSRFLPQERLMPEGWARIE
jgi:Arginine-tRNA-protein transferase, C terminus